MSVAHRRPTGAAMAIALMLSAGCSSLLPSSQTESSQFSDFDEARLAIDRLVPMQSDRQALESGKLSLAKHPNIVVLTQADIVRRFFLPNTMLVRQDLDPGVLVCIDARGACHGIELVVSRIKRERTGNFLLDVTNFHRRTETTGWRFNAVVLLVNDLVVYRAWGGQPYVSELDLTDNPLGPLQDMSVSGLVKP